MLLDAARRYLRLGYAPLPMPPGAKKPALREWTRLRLAEEDLPRYFHAIGNIGLLLGEPSGWLVDVDLDCDEAIELADDLLPPTGGRLGPTEQTTVTSLVPLRTSYDCQAS